MCDPRHTPREALVKLPCVSCNLEYHMQTVVFGRQIEEEIADLIVCSGLSFEKAWKLGIRLSFLITLTIFASVFKNCFDEATCIIFFFPYRLDGPVMCNRVLLCAVSSSVFDIYRKGTMCRRCTSFRNGSHIFFPQIQLDITQIYQNDWRR